MDICDAIGKYGDITGEIKGKVVIEDCGTLPMLKPKVLKSVHIYVNDFDPES
jgi:hypothetical protein